MSQLICLKALRQVQTLSSSIRCFQSSNRYFCASTTNQNIITDNKIESTQLVKPKNFLQVPRRTLYEHAALGLDKVQAIRENKQQLYQNNKDRYIERLASYLESGETQSILKDDLTNLIGLTENEEHLDLLEKMIISLRTEHDYSSTGWGTAVVRLYFTLNQVDRVYNNIKDYDRFGEFFNQFSAYKIGLTMLYDAGRYEQVVEIYHLARDRIKKAKSDQTYPHIPNLAIVAFGALAKMNTPEALEEAEKIYNEMDFTNNYLNNNYTRMRFVTFLSYMALSQDKPALAMNLISDMRSKNYVALRELKTLSLLKLTRYDDVVYHLRDSITRSRSGRVGLEKVELVLKEVIDTLEKSLNEIQDEATRQHLTDTIVEIKQSNMIGEATLNSIVFAPVKSRTNYLDNYAGGKQISMDRQRSFKPNYNNNRFDRDDNSMMRGGGDDNRFVPRNRSFRNQSPGGRDDFFRRDNNSGRPQRQGRSYFEEEPEVDYDDNAIETQKRFR